jgi:Mg2+ and Co2+ transporter CorA
MAQRDSAISLHLAATSTKLAETSQEVAISTSRDSAVMRVIAAITIFFLPATITATFFSTTFFSVNSNLDERAYSGWLWLYFLVTIVLTAVVVAGTWLLWKGKEKEISRRIEKQKPGAHRYIGSDTVFLTFPFQALS